MIVAGDAGVRRKRSRAGGHACVHQDHGRSAIDSLLIRIATHAVSYRGGGIAKGSSLHKGSYSGALLSGIKDCCNLNIFLNFRSCRYAVTRREDEMLRSCRENDLDFSKLDGVAGISTRSLSLAALRRTVASSLHRHRTVTASFQSVSSAPRLADSPPAARKK